ncbi:MAG TPA: glucuronate isomerase [Planctomycetaceae bacterium]|nr:glucuronate isomerase [Planctomycetaceae bacterium]HIQ23124.1 glucuronate isomerase [Planctomycetota bacterium]
MKETFITEDFLLEADAAVRLYHEHARDMPIIDYHCHLPPRQIAEDHRFENLTEIWLSGDHYKWRAMRAAGVPEVYCTGDAPDWDKFLKWAETVPKTLRNPLYHWTHMELKRPFGISDRLLDPQTARGIWEECNALLAQDAFSARGIMGQMDVVLVCTTDDPTDRLTHHAAIAADASFSIQVLPTFRPDRALAVESPAAFNAWVEKLAEAADVDIRDFDSFLEALRKRHDFFHSMGCRLSDHGLDTFHAEPYTDQEIRAAFQRVRQGSVLEPDQSRKFKSAMLYEFAVMDHEKGWTQQFHFGALRNANSRQFEALGPDTGFDSIGDLPVAESLCRFLDRLERDGRLTKTILYNINPAWNEVTATMLGNFQDGTVPGKMQYGSGWWFLDQKDGMERQLETLSNQGLLSLFVGMLTDSRSFLSYTRHEYFRRILCNLLGREMDRGLLPRDFELIGGMVRDICYNNAARYFGFNVNVL